MHCTGRGMTGEMHEKGGRAGGASCWITSMEGGQEGGQEQRIKRMPYTRGGGGGRGFGEAMHEKGVERVGLWDHSRRGVRRAGAQRGG